MQREFRNPPAQKESPGRGQPDQGDVIATHDSTITQRTANASVFGAVERAFASFYHPFLYAGPAVPGLVTIATFMTGGAA